MTSSALSQRMSNILEASNSLLDISDIAFDIFGGLTSESARSRENQAILAYCFGKFLANAWSNPAERFEELSTLFEYFGLHDEKSLLTADLCGWVFLHEKIADHFPGLLHASGRAQARVFHHVPKTGGTSIVDSIHADGSCAIIYPCDSFERMVGMYGLLALPAMTRRALTSSKKIAVCTGHFPLLPFFESQRFDDSVRGISIFIEPKLIISSAIRYYLSRIAIGLCDPGIVINTTVSRHLSKALAQPDLGLEGEHLLSAVDAIVNSAVFIDSFNDPLTRWYLGSQRRSLGELEAFFCQHPSFKLFSGASAESLTWLTGDQLPVGRSNQSLLTHTVLEQFLGKDVLDGIIDPFLGNSGEVHRLLIEITKRKSGK